MMLRRLVAAIFLPLALGQNCAEPAACAGDGKTFLGCDDWCGSLKGSGADACNNAGLLVGGIIYSLKGGGFHHNPEIPWGYSPKARTASTGKPKEVAVQKDTEAA